MMIKNWVYSTKKTDFRFVETGAGNDYGYAYAVRLNVTAKFSLLKIGATRMPYVRFYNFGRNANLFCLSPAHRNFRENEEVLHEVFSECRIPSRPGRGVQAELFNMSMPYFFKHLPEMSYLGVNEK